MRNLFFILFFFCFEIIIAKNNLRIDFSRVSPDGGIVYSAISSIQTDDKGFVWFGSTNGVYVYNGNSYTHYSYQENDTTSIASNLIYDIIKDSDDRMWFCTDKGLCYFNSLHNNFVRFQTNEISDIYSMLEISDGNYLLLTKGGLYLFDAYKNKCRYIDGQPENISAFEKYDADYILIGTRDGTLYELNLKTSLFSLIFHGEIDEITALCVDGDKFYIGYKQSGIQVVNRRGILLDYYHKDSDNSNCRISNDNIRIIMKRRSNEIWVGTYDGLTVIYHDSPSVINKTNSTLLSNSIYDIHVDNSDNVWLGTWSGGLYYYNINNFSFRSLYDLNNKQQIGVVSSFAMNDEATVWIGSENEGLILYDYNDNKVLCHISTSPVHVKSLFKYNDKLFVGSVDHGLFYLNLNKCSEKSVLHSVKLQNNKDIISSMTVFNDVLWLVQGNYRVVAYNVLNGDENTFPLLDASKKQENRIFQIEVHNDGTVLVCTSRGLFVKSPEEDKFSIVNNENLFIYCAVAVNSNEYILGSREDGLFIYNIKSGKLKEYDNGGVLNGIEIYTLQIDLQRRLWLSSNNGIYYWDLQTKRLQKLDYADGLNVRQFHPLSALSDGKGVIFWGNTMGVNYIDTHEIRVNTLSPNAYIADIFINNKELESHGTSKTEGIYYKPEIEHLELEHDENSLSFKIVSDNLLKPQKNKIRYKLDGYQNEWVEIAQGENAVFTQVPPGKYKLLFKASNNDMVWGNENFIFIHIKAPIYATVYAYILYFLLLCILLYGFYRNKIVKVSLQKEVELEKYRLNMISRLSDERTKFFVNLSHEIRIPLSLIDLPLKMLEKSSMNKEQDFHISAIRRNTNRLMRMTEQIMDYRLLEVNKLVLHRQKVEVVELLRNVVNDFEYLIQSKGMKLSFNSEISRIYINADLRMLEKVFYNLLSNSFKYSEGSPEVRINVRKTVLDASEYDGCFYIGEKIIGKALSISFIDNGVGIPSSSFQAIFERFSTCNTELNEGSGIGLHLCKEYIARHSGCIFLKSVEREGSEFTVCLPFVTDIEENESVSYEILPKLNTQEDLFSKAEDDNKPELKNNRILIIEKDDEMLCYLKQVLSGSYKCLFGKNITTGLELATELTPDLIIIDNIMPVLPGIKCIEQIKQNKSISNIPIILISAESDSNLQCKSISAGANVFLPKPFDENVLLEYIKTLLKKKTIVNVSETQQDNFTSKDFMIKLNELITSNLHQQNMDLDFLAEGLNVSRSTLFRRVKSETGNNISEYIRNLKLEKATSLIKSGDNSIEDIAVACGFNSTSYFCKCFKDKYGMTPKEFSRKK